MAAGQYSAWLPRDPQIFNSGLISVPESASLVALRGTPGIWDANGRAAPCGVAPALIGFIFADTGHNVAAGAASVLVWPVRVDQQWQIPILEAMVQTQFGIAGGDVGFVKDATTAFWYGSTADAGAQGRIIDLVGAPAGNVIGDTKWQALVQIHSTKIQVV